MDIHFQENVELCKIQQVWKLEHSANSIEIDCLVMGMGYCGGLMVGLVIGTIFIKWKHGWLFHTFGKRLPKQGCTYSRKVHITWEECNPWSLISLRLSRNARNLQNLVKYRSILLNKIRGLNIELELASWWGTNKCILLKGKEKYKGRGGHPITKKAPRMGRKGKPKENTERREQLLQQRRSRSSRVSTLTGKLESSQPSSI